MGFVLKYHRSEDRMILGFLLSEGKTFNCWVTRRQWLFLILRISRPEILPKQISGTDKLSMPTTKDETAQISVEVLAKNNSLDGFFDYRSDLGKEEEIVSGMYIDSATSVMVERIDVFLVDERARISFLLCEGGSKSLVNLKKQRVNLTLSPMDLKKFEQMLRSKAKQVGWDLEAGLKRLSAHLKSEYVNSGRVVH